MNSKQCDVTSTAAVPFSEQLRRDEAEGMEKLKAYEQERMRNMGLAGACMASGPMTTNFGEQLQKAPADGREALARLMDRLSRDERQGERARALRENLRALCMALPLEMPEAANRALEDLVNAHGGVR